MSVKWGDSYITEDTAIIGSQMDDSASAIVAAIDRLTAEVKALREAQEAALRLAQQVTLRDDDNEH